MNPRNVKNIPYDGNGEREWSHDCSECFDDCGTCCLGWCCPCMVYSQIQSRLQYLETRNAPHPESGESCNGDCFVHGLLQCCCGLGWVLQIGQRTAVRNRYRIAGDGCSDFMMAYCCTPCELTQVSRELELEERALTGGAGIPAPMPTNTGTYPEKR
ncbi:PLAC8-domain-containing protein [Fomitiporia mediterranea MF3/22]|uniref:PLAC8-domain-containing protein n=1 Tax=Fomitiporia mediterranea (strain MF3/22) TaxID=694068 RepID=UPI0004408B8A|nr:PLAC8-domain-containing protein [Fomitiporia mediterranea MF3/22]EJD05591.1 PLAC8-domain-containing protein [Fomitiporia mediterranea MF3/22]